MAIEWITPKTDWVSSDPINISDVNRIVNNLDFLKRYVHSIKVMKYEPMPHPESVLEYPYADELNAIENNLEKLNLQTYALPIGNTQIFVDNGKGWDYAELNRIESAQLRLLERIKIGRKPLNMLSFTLGKQKGFRP